MDSIGRGSFDPGVPWEWYLYLEEWYETRLVLVGRSVNNSSRSSKFGTAYRLARAPEFQSQ